MLAYRDQTLKSKGDYTSTFDEDIQIFEKLKDCSKILKKQIRPRTPKNIQTPEEMRRNL